MSENRPLWAPWRIEFIRSPKPCGCFLCGNEAPNQGKEEEALIVYRGKSVFVILNRYPYNSGHLLIAPYRHAGDISELTAAERHELIDVTAEAKNILAELLRPEAYNVGFNLGKAAGAGVADHLHCHIVPRWNGDTNFMPVLADTRCVPEALEATAELIRTAWQSRS